MDRSNIIVNYLPPAFTETMMAELFGKYGKIHSMKIVRDRITGLSMGFGFVNFETNEAADSAIAALNGMELAPSKVMKLSVARPAWKANIHSNVYVSGLPGWFNEQHIKNSLFEEYSPSVEHVRILKDAEKRRSRLVAVVRFDSVDSAMAVIRRFHNRVLTWQNPEGVDEHGQAASTFQLVVRPWRPEFRPEKVEHSSTPNLTSGWYAAGQRLYGMPDRRTVSGATTSTLATPLGSPTAADGPVGLDRYGGARFLTSDAGLMHQPDSGYPRHLAANRELAPTVYFPESRGDPTVNLRLSPRIDGLPNGDEGSDNTLFVFYLPPDATDNTLRVLFEPYGPLNSVKVIIGKGYGFVSYREPSDAAKAVQALNGFKLGYKHLKVEVKRRVRDGLSGSPQLMSMSDVLGSQRAMEQRFGFGSSADATAAASAAAASHASMRENMGKPAPRGGLIGGAPSANGGYYYY